MDPTNNPMPTPSPEPNVEPDANAAPEAMPTPEPMAQAGTPVGPAEPGAAPVNPIINPTGSPVNPVIQPGGQGLAATDPIMRPEPAPEPDPIEEELKAPMKAAAPVPGSIGSAVSGPTEAPAEMSVESSFAMSEQGSVPNVSFNDPAVQPQPDTSMDANAKPAKNKNNNTTLIILIAVAAVIVVVLIVILVMQLMGNGSNSSSSTNTQTAGEEVVIDEEEDEEEEVEELTDGTMSCTREMNTEELAKFDGATSGTVKVTVDFANGTLSKISMVNSIVTGSEEDENATPTETEAQEITAEALTNGNAITYYLNMGVEGKELPYNLIRTNYEDLDFTCEVL